MPTPRCHAFVFTPIAFAACHVAGVAPGSDELLAADREFERDTQQRRLTGWLAAFDANGSQVDDTFRPVTGHDAIAAHMGPFFADPRNHLTWTPDAARLSEGGRLGTTTGRWQLSRDNDDGTRSVLATGRYFDVWRKQTDGSWKLLYDVGDADVASTEPPQEQP